MAAVVAAVPSRAARQETAAARACLQTAESADAAVACLVTRVPVSVLEQEMFGSSEVAGAVLRVLSEAMATPRADRAGPYIADAARARSRRLSGLGAWTDEQGEAFLRLQLIDPDRFVGDAAFRARVLPLLPRAFDPAASPRLRDQMLYSLNNLPGVDYDTAEQIELAWGAIPRSSRAREVPYAEASLPFPDDASGAVAASIFSFPGPFLDPDAVMRFMRGLRAVRPERMLLALIDLPMRTAIEGAATASAWTLIETHGRGFSPWPRDPFSVLRRADGGVTFVVRPNAQPFRADDNDMAREVVQGLPARIDAAWKQPTWTRGPVPFHNGQILHARDAVWISAYTVEARALQILGVARGPSEGVTTADAWRAYRNATLEAARELGAMYGKPAKFVHALPETLVPGMIAEFGGGGGFDLDSLVTVLDGPAGARMLVASVAEGERLLARAPAQDLATFSAGFDLAASRQEDTRSRLVAAQASSRARALARFLDLTAAHLAAAGATVERVPLFFVPVALLADRAHLTHEDFLVTWNNVVLETTKAGRRAEGFTSMLDAGDRAARAAFTRAGYTLDLLPLIPQSVILNGGYRCASQHVR